MRKGCLLLMLNLIKERFEGNKEIKIKKNIRKISAYFVKTEAQVKKWFPLKK